MKEICRKIAALFLIAIVLLSSSSFSIYKHFCGDNLVTISTEKLDSCCESEITSQNFNKLIFSEQNCCKNETTIKDIQIFDTNSPNKIAKNTVLFFTSFHHNFIQKTTFVTATKNYYKDFYPPKLVSNKQVLFQTFLI